MGMNPGAYRETVEIHKTDGFETDGIGNRIPRMALYMRCRAYVNNLSGKEYWEAAQAQAENTVVFTLRCCRKLREINTREYSIRWGGKEYNIVSIDNVQYKNETMKIRATAKG